MTDELRTVMTCGAFPEQYDVYDGDKMVGYLRLRSGYFTGEAVQGDALRWTTKPILVYRHEWPDEYMGAFDSDTERDEHVAAALAAIRSHYESAGVGEPGTNE